MNFRSQLDRHLKAVRDRDMDTLVGTLSTKEELTLIMAYGKLTKTKDEFIEFHRAWFNDQDWTMTHKIVHETEVDDTASAIVEADYKDLDADGKPIEMKLLVGLVFRKEDGQWRLIHDQNTALKS